MVVAPTRRHVPTDRNKVYGYYTRIGDDGKLMVYRGNFDAFALGIRHNL